MNNSRKLLGLVLILTLMLSAASLIAETRLPYLAKSESVMQTLAPEEGTTKNNFFVQVNSGMGLFLKSTSEKNNDFTLYGEAGSLAETYKLKSNLLFDINMGKYFEVGPLLIKGGVGFSYWSYKYSGNYAFSLPHPFLKNVTRTLEMTDDFKNTVYNFYAYGLFCLIESDKFLVTAGPLVGYSTGKINTLGDMGQIEEKSPFRASDITIASKTYIEDSISKILTGLIVNFEYSIISSLAVTFNLNVIYVDPKINNLGKRANFLQTQYALGLQYNI